MGKKDILISTLRDWDKDKEDKKEYRKGLLGRGTAGEKSAKVAGREGYFWVRNRQDPNQVYAALGGSHPDIPGWPVIIGQHQVDTAVLRIIDSDWVQITNLNNYSGTASSIGAHHWQHETYAWDMVNVDKFMIIPFRTYPSLNGAAFDVIVQYDEAAYLGPKLINFELMDDYETSPIRGVRLNVHTGSLVLADEYVMICLKEDCTGFELIRSDSVVTPSPPLGPGGFPLYLMAGYTPVAATTLTKPSITAALANNLYPISRIALRQGSTSLKLSDVQPLLPLYTFPGKYWATGIWIDGDGYFTGTTVESALIELAQRTYSGIASDIEAATDTQQRPPMKCWFTGDGSTTEFLLTGFALIGSTQVSLGKEYQQLNFDYFESRNGSAIKFNSAPTGSTRINVQYLQAHGNDDINLLTDTWTYYSGTLAENGHLSDASIDSLMVTGTTIVPLARQAVKLRSGNYRLVRSFRDKNGLGDRIAIFNSGTVTQRWAYDPPVYGTDIYGREEISIVLPVDDWYTFQFYEKSNHSRFSDIRLARISSLHPSQQMFGDDAILKNGCFYDGTTHWTLTGGFGRAEEINRVKLFVGGILKSLNSSANVASQSITLEAGKLYTISLLHYNPAAGSADIRIRSVGSTIWTSGELNYLTAGVDHWLHYTFFNTTAGTYTFEARSNNNSDVYFGELRIY